jgi:hypothetical protein
MGGLNYNKLVLSESSLTQSGKHVMWWYETLVVEDYIGEIEDENEFMLQVGDEENYMEQNYSLLLLDDINDMSTLTLFGNVVRAAEIDYAIYAFEVDSLVSNGPTTAFSGKIQGKIDVLSDAADKYRIGRVYTKGLDCANIKANESVLINPYFQKNPWWSFTYHDTIYYDKNHNKVFWCHCSEGGSCLYSGKSWKSSAFVGQAVKSVSPTTISHRGSSVLTFIPNEGESLLGKCFSIGYSYSSSQITMSPVDEDNHATLDPDTCQSWWGCSLFLLANCSDPDGTKLLQHGVQLYFDDDASIIMRADVFTFT